MPDSPRLFVWLQHSPQRDDTKTRASIQASDIGLDYTCVTDRERTFPDDYPALQLWWEEQMLAMAAKAQKLGCSWILKLEDDVVVNRHIVHNVLTWPALQDPRFGVGTLFSPNYWKNTPWVFKQSPHSGAVYKDSVDVEGAQGQLLRVDMVEQLLPLTRQARADRGLDKPTDSVSFDWSVTRAAHYLGRSTHPGEPFLTFVHDDPSLVDLHESSCKSIIGNVDQDPQFHYWGDDHFSPTWKRYVASSDSSSSS